MLSQMRSSSKGSSKPGDRPLSKKENIAWWSFLIITGIYFLSLAIWSFQPVGEPERRVIETYQIDNSTCKKEVIERGYGCRHEIIQEFTMCDPPLPESVELTEPIHHRTIP